MTQSATHFPLRMVRLAYLTAFLLIFLLATLGQGIIQLALHNETLSRQAATIISSQAVASQRIDRDAILFLNGTLNHTATIAEMQHDLAAERQNIATFNARYGGRYPALAQLDGGHGRAGAVYLTVSNAAYDLIRRDGLRYASAKARVEAELPDISTIFYTEPEQLRNIQDSLAIVDADTDSTIRSIQVIEISLYSLTVLVLLFEGVAVVRPALKRLLEVARQEEEAAAGQEAQKEQG